MQVRELMSRGITTIPSDASCRQAVERMYRNKVRHLPVVQGGALVGIVTDRDLRRHLFARGLLGGSERRVDDVLAATAVSDIMSSPVISVGPDDPVDVAAHRMVENRIGSLPVVEGGRPVGIITETDLLRQICRADTSSPDVDYIVVSYP
jgi:acetoin utilization protein AcuB